MSESATPNESVDVSSISADLAAMREELKSEREARARLEGRVQATSEAKQKPAAEQPKVYSKSELQYAVDAGTITQDQMDAYLETQTRESIRKEMASQIETAKREMRTQAEIEAEIDAYKETIPSIMEEGSEDRRRVESEFEKLIRLGLPSNATTELLAVKAAFGPVPKRGTDKTAKARQTDQVGAGGGRAASSDKSSSPLDAFDLSDRQRSYYEKMVDRGIYKSWDDVKAELSSYQKKSA